jgi:hypothetical protein
MSTGCLESQTSRQARLDGRRESQASSSYLPCSSLQSAAHRLNRDMPRRPGVGPIRPTLHARDAHNRGRGVQAAQPLHKPIRKIAGRRSDGFFFNRAKHGYS